MRYDNNVSFFGQCIAFRHRLLMKCQAAKSGTWPPKPVLFKKDLQNGPVNLKLVASTLVLPYYDVTIRYLFLLHLYRSYGCYCTLTDFDQIGDI